MRTRETTHHYRRPQVPSRGILFQLYLRVGGIIVPILGGFIGDHQLWLSAFIPAGLLCFLGAALALTLKPVTDANKFQNPIATIHTSSARAAWQYYRVLQSNVNENEKHKHR